MNICIIGGGTAGWLTALLLTKERPEFNYTLIESSKIGVIGVGEGSTGLFVDLVREKRWGLDPQEFIVETEGLPKLGIRFKNWKGDDTWFDSPLNGSHTSSIEHLIDIFSYTCVLKDIPIDYSCEVSTLTKHNLTNYAIESNNIVEYDVSRSAYHFDAHKLGKHLKSKVKNKIRLIDSEVDDVKINDDQVTSIHLSNGESITADLFIDCSGLSRTLSKAKGQKTITFTETLPCDRVFLFKPEIEPEEVLPVTMAHARNNGWIFEIPTRKKVGRGYIYSSKFASDDQIKKELEEVYNCPIIHSRTINFEPFCLENVMDGNVVSIGLSSSFFEPLQATSIHNTIVQIRKLIELVLNNNISRTIDPVIVQDYNNTISKLFNDTASLIAMHYECCLREDTPFWKFIKYEKVKDKKTTRILSLADKRLLRHQDFEVNYGSTGVPLWTNIMAGLGFFKKDVIESQFKTWLVDSDIVLKNIEDIKNKLLNEAYSRKFITQTELNRHLNKLVNNSGK
jgi:hypothetical protein